MYTFGSGTGGQLGLGGTKDVYQVCVICLCSSIVLVLFLKQPSMVVANFHDGRSHEVITSAAAGVDYTLFLNNKGTTIIKLFPSHCKPVMFRRSIWLWS